ncbi:hypothetical protein BJX96DRAFT_166225 [Aspergillus floccosus]
MSDIWRTGLIKSSSAILAPIEDRLERSGNQEKAQRLRRLQHRLFGLTKTHAEEAIWAISQADEQANRRLVKLRSLPPVNDPAELKRRKEKSEYYDKFLAENAERLEEVEEIKDKLHRLMEHTPVYRAMTSRQRDPDWYLTGWLRYRCAGAGGCCGRSCGCCEKPRETTGAQGRFGHCTPNCLCCIEHRGYPINLRRGRYPGKLAFNVKQESSDLYSGLLMNSHVWGLPPGR